jgi:hypothetical protein
MDNRYQYLLNCRGGKPAGRPAFGRPGCRSRRGSGSSFAGFRLQRRRSESLRKLPARLHFRPGLPFIEQVPAAIRTTSDPKTPAQSTRTVQIEGVAVAVQASLSVKSTEELPATLPTVRVRKNRRGPEPDFPTAGGDYLPKYGSLRLRRPSQNGNSYRYEFRIALDTRRQPRPASNQGVQVPFLTHPLFCPLAPAA